jgi:hypothetical protein
MVGTFHFSEWNRGTEINHCRLSRCCSACCCHDANFNFALFIISAAWGEVQNRRDRGEVLTIQHWELGVFVSPRTLGVDSMGPGEGLHSVRTLGVPNNSMTSGARATNTASYQTVDARSRAVIPLPYKFRPTPYSPSDQPWVVDLLG